MLWRIAYSTDQIADAAEFNALNIQEKLTFEKVT